jgi:hypothetical protein
VDECIGSVKLCCEISNTGPAQKSCWRGVGSGAGELAGEDGRDDGRWDGSKKSDMPILKNMRRIIAEVEVFAWT